MYSQRDSNSYFHLERVTAWPVSKDRSICGCGWPWIIDFLCIRQVFWTKLTYTPIYLSAWLDSNQRWIIGFADQWFRPLAHRRNLYWLFVVLIKLCSPLFLLIRKRPLDPTSDWLCYCDQQTLRYWKLIPFSKSVLLRYQDSNLN